MVVNQIKITQHKENVMKPSVSSITATAITLVLMLAIHGFAAGPCDHVTLEWIQGQAPLPPEAKLVHKAPSFGVCEAVVALNGDLVPLYAGQDYLIAGQMFAAGDSLTSKTMAGLSDVAEAERKLAEEKEALAVAQRQAFFKANAAGLEELVSYTFGPGSADGAIFVITDPNCSHCKAMLPELEQLSFEARKTLKIIIYPVLGPKSRDMAAHALCKNFDYQAYTAMDMPDSPETCEAGGKLLEKTLGLLGSGKISFVPVVVAQDGSWVVEGNDICAVRTHLGLKPGEGETGGGCGAEK